MLLKLTIAMIVMFAIALAGEWTLANAVDRALSKNPPAQYQPAPKFEQTKQKTVRA